MATANFFTLRNLAESAGLAALAIAIPYFVFESSSTWHYLAVIATFIVSPGIIIGSFLHGDPHLATRPELYAGVQAQFFVIWFASWSFKKHRLSIRKHDSVVG